MAETVRGALEVLAAMDRAELVASTVIVMVRAAASLVHRLVRTIRTVTVITMVKVVVRAALTVVVREVRVASVAVRVEQAASTVVARVFSDLVLVEWAEQLRFLQ